MLCVERDQYAWRSFIAADLAVVADCLAIYRTAPEVFFKTYLGYEPPPGAKGYRVNLQPDPKPNVEPARRFTLKDLLDDDERPK